MPTVHFPAWLLLPMHRNFMGKIGAEEESEDGNLLRLFRFIFSRFLATGCRGEGWPSRIRRPGSEPLGGHLAPSLTSSRLSPVSGFTARHLRPRGLSQPTRERAGPRGFRRTRCVKQPRAQGRGRAHAPEQGDPHVPSVSVGPAPSADLGASASASASGPAALSATRSTRRRPLRCNVLLKEQPRAHALPKADTRWPHRALGTSRGGGGGRLTPCRWSGPREAGWGPEGPGGTGERCAEAAAAGRAPHAALPLGSVLNAQMDLGRFPR